MKKFITIASLFLLAGCSLGGVELTKNAVFCESNGEQFSPGESVSAGDGCNFCICSAEGALENCSKENCDDAVGLANPAAVKCSVDGFSYEIREDESGAQSGVCIDAENKECNDWEYFRGECELGAPEAAEEEAMVDESGEGAEDQTVEGSEGAAVEEPAAEEPATAAVTEEEPAALTPPLE